MLPPLFDITPFTEAIKDNILVITANQRLSAKAIDAWGMQQRTEQQIAWQQPTIYAVNQWVDSLWFQLQTRGDKKSFLPIASKEQERILWHRVTKNCGKMQTEQLAKQAAAALKNLARWNLSPNDVQKQQHFADEQYQTFIQWSNEYQSLLKKNRLISEEDKINTIINAFYEKQLSTEEQCILIGFDDISPLIQRLLDAAITGDIRKASSKHTPKSLVRKNYSNQNAEITAAAHWARDILQNHSDVRIGIIAPELGQNRDAIVHMLTQVFEPQQHTLASKQATPPFNISAGVPLGSTPLIADSLRLLTILQYTQTLDDCLQWLYSPFWGKPSVDQTARTQLAKTLEQLEQFEFSADQLRFYAQKIAGESAESIFTYLRKINELKQSWSFHAQPSTWVERFLSILNILNWPGEKSSDSLEYQQTQLWYQVLESFAGLDSVLGVLSVREAVKELTIMVKSTPFQAKVPDSPIQVLGILEGAGLRFTHCWVMGLNQQFWPPAPSPNPLLPFSFQKKHNMPNATAHRELAYAESLTENYRHCADEIVMSYADGDPSGDIHWQPSRLISELPLIESEQTNTGTPYKAPHPPFDVIACESAPPLQTNNDDNNNNGNNAVPLKGGAGVLKAMVENPFDAFARFRLGAKKVDEPVNGFSAKAQGIILHQSLATIWQTLKTQETLIAYTHEKLAHLVQSAVTRAVRAQQAGKQTHLGDNLCQLEIQRQSEIILNWLEIEKQRPAFTVEYIEESLSITIKGLVIELRIDRIDRLADGSLLIIDYKTAVATLAAWKAQEPSDPQLPLYLLACSEPVSGIAFAQINIKALTIKGLHNGEQAMPGIKGFSAIGDNKLNLPKTWEGTKQHWQTTIEAILTRYIDGDTAITLNNTNGFNQDLLALNRFYEKDLLSRYITVSPQSS